MKRLVDSALWRSDKLKKVPAEFRAEFANLLPLAQANGSFELSPERIWSDVYSYNRPDITLEVVKQMVEAFVHAGMIIRWRQDGKLWGHFRGITEGRLPKQSERERGDYHITAPDPPEAKCNSTKGKRKTEPRGENAGARADPASGLSLSVGSSSGLGSSFRVGVGGDVGTRAANAATPAPPLDLQAEDPEVEMAGTNLKDTIIAIGKRVTGVVPPSQPGDWTRLRALAKAWDARKVVDAFEQYLLSNPALASVSGFAREAEQIMRGQVVAAVEPEQANAVDQLLVKMAGISSIDIVFTRAQQMVLARMLAAYAEADILWAYQEFYSKRDDFNMKFAARDWVETGEQYIRNLLLERQHRVDVEDAPTTPLPEYNEVEVTDDFWRTE